MFLALNVLRFVLSCVQVKMTAYSAVQVHQPDLVLLLGDQLDEGGLPTPQSDWEVCCLLCMKQDMCRDAYLCDEMIDTTPTLPQEYVARFRDAFATFKPLKTLYLVMSCVRTEQMLPVYCQLTLTHVWLAM